MRLLPDFLRLLQWDCNLKLDLFQLRLLYWLASESEECHPSRDSLRATERCEQTFAVDECTFEFDVITLKRNTVFSVEMSMRALK